MSNIRHFSGSREFGKKKSIALEINLIEKQKKGKLDPKMRYKMIFKRRQEEVKEKLRAADEANQNKATGKSSLVFKRKNSVRAEQALKELAMKKAAKEAKALRKMVIVQPRQFPNGSINKNGRIYDIAGNIVGQVNVKTGNVTTSTGWFICKYKPKSYMTNLMIQQAIDKHSPYFINQRKMLAMQQAMNSVYGSYQDPNAMNVHGMSAQAAMLGAGFAPGDQFVGVHGGTDDNAHRASNVTAWGAMSNNAWGTYSNNVHGTLGENVHGTVNSDVWGSVSVNSGMWGQRGVRMYGTGSGENLLGGLLKHILGLFGYQSKSAREAQRQARALRAAAQASGGGAPRQSAAPRRR